MNPRDSASFAALSRRERQVMHLVYELGESTAAQIRDRMEDAPSYSAVRALLRTLVEKGHLKHRMDGPRYVYSAVVPRGRAVQAALKDMVKVFFQGDPEEAVAALLKLPGSKLTPDQVERMTKMIDQARKEER